MLARDVMQPEPARLSPRATFREAVELLHGTGASEIVVEDGGRFTGILAEGDMLRALLPDLAEIEAAGGSLEDAYRAFLSTGGRLAAEPIDRLVIRDPLVVGPDEPLMRIATLMTARHIRRLMVVADGAVIGVVTRADVCRGAVG